MSKNRNAIKKRQQVKKMRDAERRKPARRATSPAHSSGSPSASAGARDIPFNLSREDITDIARRIGEESVVYAAHRPDPGAKTRECFKNAIEKMKRDGGDVMWGWTFHAASTPLGPYAWAINHGIWISPDGEHVDVTPFVSDAKNRPAVHDGRVAFLPDLAADPFIAAGVLGTQPKRFFPLGSNPDPQLVAIARRFEEDDAREVAALVAQARLQLSSEL